MTNKYGQFGGPLDKLQFKGWMGQDLAKKKADEATKEARRRSPKKYGAMGQSEIDEEQQSIYNETYRTYLQRGSTNQEPTAGQGQIPHQPIRFDEAETFLTELDQNVGINGGGQFTGAGLREQGFDIPEVFSDVTFDIRANPERGSGYEMDLIFGDGWRVLDNNPDTDLSIDDNVYISPAGDRIPGPAIDALPSHIEPIDEYEDLPSWVRHDLERYAEMQEEKVGSSEFLKQRYADRLDKQWDRIQMWNRIYGVGLEGATAAVQEIQRQIEPLSYLEDEITRLDRLIQIEESALMGVKYEAKEVQAYYIEDHEAELADLLAEKAAFVKQHYSELEELAQLQLDRDRFTGIAMEEGAKVDATSIIPAQVGSWFTNADLQTIRKHTESLVRGESLTGLEIGELGDSLAAIAKAGDISYRALGTMQPLADLASKDLKAFNAMIARIDSGEDVYKTLDHFADNYEYTKELDAAFQQMGIQQDDVYRRWFNLDVLTPGHGKRSIESYERIAGDQYMKERWHAIEAVMLHSNEVYTEFMNDWNDLQLQATPEYQASHGMSWSEEELQEQYQKLFTRMNEAEQSGYIFRYHNPIDGSFLLLPAPRGEMRLSDREFREYAYYTARLMQDRIDEAEKGIGTLTRIKRGFYSGAAGIFDMTGSVLKMVSQAPIMDEPMGPHKPLDSVSDFLNDAGDFWFEHANNVRRENLLPQSDPISINSAVQVTSEMVPLVATSIFAAVLTGGTSGVAELFMSSAGRSIIQSIGKAIPLSIGMSLVEAGVEAGANHNQALREGKSESEARQIALKTFTGNMAILVPANAAQFGIMYPGASGAVYTRLARAGGKVAAEQTMEGLQEIPQEWVNAQAAGRKFGVFSPEAWDIFLRVSIGALPMGIMGGAPEIGQAIRGNTQAQATWEDIVVKMEGSNSGPERTLLNAVDEFAEREPEVFQEIVDDTIEVLQRIGRESLPVDMAEDIAPAEEGQELNKEDAVEVLDAALETGAIEQGTYDLAMHLVNTVDPTFNINSLLTISPEEKLATEEEIAAYGGKEGGRYRKLGQTSTYFGEGGTRTFLDLYQGHDADTLVEEWYHRDFDLLSDNDRAAYDEYHTASGDSRPVNEHYAQEGRDFFFSSKLHESAGSIRHIFESARDRLMEMVGRIREIRTARIPEKIEKMYKRAGTAPKAKKSVPTRILELEQKESELTGLEQELKESTLASFRGEYGKGVGSIRSVIKEGQFPEYLTRKQAEIFTKGKKLDPAKAIKKGENKGKYPFDVALDSLSKELNMTPDEIKVEIERIYGVQDKAKGLKHDVAITIAEFNDEGITSEDMASAYDEITASDEKDIGQKMYETILADVYTVTAELETIETEESSGLLDMLNMAMSDYANELYADASNFNARSLVMSREVLDIFDFIRGSETFAVGSPLESTLNSAAESLSLTNIESRVSKYSNIEDIIPQKGKEGVSRATQLAQIERQSQIWFSPLRTAVEDMPAHKMPADQFMAALRKRAGVKAEELQWTGLEEWAQSQDTITKDMALEYLYDNSVVIEETVKGEGKAEGVTEPELQKLRDDLAEAEAWETRAREAALTTLEEAGVSQVDRLNMVNNMGWWARIEPEAARRSYEKAEQLVPNYNWYSLQEAHQDTVDRSQDLDEAKSTIRSKDTKFEQYALPGGRGYRELLLRLPKQFTQFGLVRDRNRVIVEEHFDHNDEPYYKVAEYSAQETFLGYVSDRYSTREAAENKADAYWNEYVSEKPKALEDYYSHHWTEPNVLAHIRFNERTGPNGEKILFIEEIQSDWHQAGKKKGYKTGDLATAKKELSEAEQAYDLWVRSVPVSEFAAMPLSEVRARPESERVIEAKNTLYMIQTGIPDAPFKKTWHELSLKRAIKFAVDQGFDTVGWTTGEQQADRYDLSKHLESIQWNPDDNRLIGIDHQADKVIDRIVPQQQLENYVGKEVATKLIEVPEGTGVRKVEGLDLKVGGQGMKGFYDQMLPAAASKIGKKHGARVGEIEMRTGNAPEDILAQYPENIPFQEANRATVHAMTLTDSLKDEYRAGVPSFQLAEIAEPETPRKTPEDQVSDLQRKLDVALERLGEFEKPPTEVKTGIATGEEPRTTARQDVLEIEMLGQSDIPHKIPRSWEDAKERAIRREIPRNAHGIATSVLENPRAIDDVETAGLVVRLAQIKSDYEQLESQVADEESIAQIADKGEKMLRLEQEFDTIKQALYMSGSEKGRTLNMQKMVIDEKLDILNVLSRAKAKKKEPLTAAEEEKFRNLVKEYEALESQVTGLQAENEKLKANRDIRTSGIKRYGRMNQSQKDESRDTLIDDIKKLMREGCAVG